MSPDGRLNAFGEPEFEVKPGDLVYVAPGEKHWHGAVPNQFFVHFAFTASGKTNWMETVSDDEYSNGFS